ncbi:nascent polypeptide-associated complex protein [Halobacterium bonnevillei]|uniref:Nascent polypeptide-associated complex protein n=1 Tax=Halobacterium bonnevillei TaxID=2692200 RepID=A0A6B0SPG0_9EURY|nr:nascent polypeptide-associated complex protein [Halobacterium bonnevillei]MXR21521.1 nascent polypeptide-associated complex protein [Halobacterium bonnevillei]
MFGGGGMNPRKMKQMMKQMGIDVDEIDASEVVITKADGDELVFSDPDVTKMDARGQETYQIIGEPETRASAGGAIEAGEPEEAEAEADEGSESGGIPPEDVELVVTRTGASEADARAALEATDGDLAAAISRLE